MTLTADLDVAIDEAIGFVFVVTNPGSDVVTLEFRSGQAVDFAVREGDEDVWRWSDGRMFTQAVWSEALEPGGSVAYDATWADPVPGSYEVVATLEAENAEVRASAAFTV